MRGLVERVSELMSDVDLRVVAAKRERKRQLRFSRNKIDIGIDYDDLSFYVFMAKKSGDKRRTIEFEASTEEEAKEKISFLKEALERFPPNPFFRGLADKKYSYPKPAYDERILEIDPKASVEEAIEAAREAGAERVAGTLYVYDVEGYLKTPFNEGYDRSVFATLSVRAFADKLTSGHRVNAASRLEDFDPAGTGRKAGEFAKLGSKERVKLDAGKYDMIAGPLAFADFVSSLGRMISAAAVLMGFSALKFELVGQQIGREDFTLESISDPGVIGRRLFDDEGVPTRDVAVIDKGVLRTHLHSTSTARLLSEQGIPAESTGNAGILFPHPRQLRVKPGDASFEEIVSETKRGILVTNVRYTRFQSYVTGDFSTIPRDAMLYVENGELKASVRGLRVNGNVLERLKNVDLLGKELHQIYRREIQVPSVVPYARIKDVTFTEARRVFSMLVCTTNPGKRAEFRELLKGFDVRRIKDKGVEIQGDLRSVAAYAAATLYAKYREPLIVEDAGLFVDALNGFPGPYSSYAMRTIGYRGILKLLGDSEDRGAEFRSVVAFAYRDGIVLFEGAVRGRITSEPRGSSGFGFDPIFVPEGSDRTFAEMSVEEKNAFSHRAKAVKKLIDRLNKVSFYGRLVGL